MIVPTEVTDEIKEFAQKIGGLPPIFVPVEPTLTSQPDMCHQNAANSMFPAIRGFLIVFNDRIGMFEAYSHSIVNQDGRFVDITPSNVSQILFSINTRTDIEVFSYSGTEVYINKVDVDYQENSEMYYVYGLVDPRDGSVFYVGKGQKRRWREHLSPASLEDNTPKNNVIKKIHELGLNVGVIFLAQDIVSESTAYDIEEMYISQYGRIVDGTGCLTNICESARPPNHKGKSYDEIYGNRSGEQRKIRHDLQLEAGGWFRGHKHTEENKQRFSRIVSERARLRRRKVHTTREDIDQYLAEYMSWFGACFAISKWNWFLKKKGYPPVPKYSVELGTYITDYVVTNFRCKIEHGKQQMLWFNNGERTIRIPKWKIEHGDSPPEGFVPGRKL